VSVSTTYSDLHELVDRLTPDQAAALRAVARQLVTAPGPSSGIESGRVRRLSFAGTLRSGKGDLAARSEDIIRAELGDAA
jgi:hypothetical protein